MKRRTLHVGALWAVVSLLLITACAGSNRPRELSLSEVDPCRLVAPQDLQRLQVEANPQPVPGIEGVDEEGLGCQYLPLTHESVTISGVMNQGIDRWTGGSVDDAQVKEVAPIRGFPTVRVRSRLSTFGQHEECILYVDVADGQSLKVLVAENSEENDPTCVTARNFGEAALATLLKS